MRLALLSDIHANRQALDACLAHAEAAGAERLAFLGDLVGYGGDPAYVVQRVMALDVLQHLAALEESAGNSRQALRYLREYQALGDTIFDQSAAQRIASMEAREETQRAREANASLMATQAAQEAVIARQRLVVTLGSLILLLVVALLAVLVRYNRRDRARLLVLSETNAELEKAHGELAVPLKEGRTLSGLIPICANCKNVRDDQGYWAAVETWVSQHSDARFSHGICQSCGPALYGELWGEMEGGGSTVAEPPPSRAGSDDPHGAHQ